MRMIMGVLSVLWVAACATSGPVGVMQSEGLAPADQEVPANSLSAEQIQGFEAELDGQYRQLGIHYEEFDGFHVRPVDNHGEEAHRLHRKLKRRHLTLARLHEDRLALGLGDREADRELAALHRRAAKWHEARFQVGGSGVEPADAEIDAVRKALRHHWPQ
jgi:hypothetical protein